MHARFLFIALLSATACGSISDPTQHSEAVATVSGALTGTTVPSNARVALVWKKGTAGGFAVGSDVPVVGGHFTMSLGVPADAYFFGATDDGTSSSTPVASPPQATTGGGGSSGSGDTGTSGKAFRPLDLSGQISVALTGAIAGFVVYADTNGDGTLDITGATASSSDQILGGSTELILTYLKGGGALDYEKLRDSSGILPAAGFNLVWTKKGRWLALNLVELTLSSSAELPSAVCDADDTVVGTNSVDAGATVSPPDNVVSNPPDAPTGSSGSDPSVVCAPDGRSYTYKTSPCVSPSPLPAGLCNGGAVAAPIICASDPPPQALLPNETPPGNWPCPVGATNMDAGRPD